MSDKPEVNSINVLYKDQQGTPVLKNVPFDFEGVHEHFKKLRGHLQGYTGPVDILPVTWLVRYSADLDKAPAEHRGTLVRVSLRYIDTMRGFHLEHVFSGTDPEQYNPKKWWDMYERMIKEKLTT